MFLKNPGQHDKPSKVDETSNSDKTAVLDKVDLEACNLDTQFFITLLLKTSCTSNRGYDRNGV